MSENIIIGLGTGRCGTVSLSNLLNSQKDSFFSHEWDESHKWDSNIYYFKNYLEGLGCLPLIDFYGDVSFYNLPYCTDLQKLYTNIKFIILKRDRQETINSYIAKTPGRNHWQAHDGSSFRFCNWDKCYPKFNANNKADAIGMYWDMYYEQCSKLDQSKCYHLNTEDLNNEEKCLDMLSFCNFESPTYFKAHDNKTE
jgi:hypothetical protein